MKATSRNWIVLAAALSCACSKGPPQSYVGFVDAPVSAVATQVAGRADAVLVHEGDRVKKGQLVARLESSTYEASVAVAEANLDRAKEAVALAEANLTAATPAVAGSTADIARTRAARDEAELAFDRVQHLAASGSLSAADLDAARARLLEARATLDGMIAARSQSQGRLSVAYASVNDARVAVRSSEAVLRLAEAQLAQTRIKSPFDGVVVSRNLEEGEWAAPGTPVVTIEDEMRLWVRLDVEETGFGGLHLDQGAVVSVIALPGRSFRGRVAEIGAEGDFALDRDVKRGRPDLRTFLVRVSLEERSPALRPGMTAEVRLGAETLRSPSDGGADE